MSELRLETLINKLNKTCVNVLDAAAGLCVSKTNYDVEIEHFLLKLTETSNTDIVKILKHFEIDDSELRKDLRKEIENFDTGNSRIPDLSNTIISMFQNAWIVASIYFQDTQIRSAYILYSLLNDSNTKRLLLSTSEHFRNISIETLDIKLDKIISGSIEDDQKSISKSNDNKINKSITPALDLYTEDLVEKAKQGKIDPIVERDVEIRKIIDILIRRKQNNPILTGEAGVGKTAVVEGFAIRVAEGDVPPLLKNASVRSLDLGKLQAGASIKGEYEKRLKSVITEVKSSHIPIILFIDEAHTLIGSGGPQGTGDAANLLKPALARGELRTIAATTWSEYKKYFEKDPALTRRFQVIKVNEPTEEKALNILQSLVPSLEKHHNVMITSDSLIDAVRLTNRYITDRYLPDKCLSILDTACAKIAISKSTNPPPIEDKNRHIQKLDRQLNHLKRDSLMGNNNSELIKSLEIEKEKIELELEKLKKQFTNEKKIIEQIQAIKNDLQSQNISEIEQIKEKQIKLKKFKDDLLKLTGKTPLIQYEVNSHTVSEIISQWTEIPVGQMMTDEINKILQVESNLKERIIGQDHAITSIANMVKTSYAGIEDPDKPTGVFLFVGPSGVGKTETALALSNLLFGDEKNLISINMSEYQESHSVSGLKGSPPGYVGYGEGGILTESVRKKPYSVVLLDEIEKAHKDVTDLFYQVFDKGILEDGEGRKIDFKNTIIILTSNVASDIIQKLCADPETLPEPDDLASIIRPELLKTFKPAFLSRLKIIPYYPLDDKKMKQIAKIKLNKIVKRLFVNKKISFIYSEELIEFITNRCVEIDNGARNVDLILTNTLMPEMSIKLLTSMATGKKINTINVSIKNNKFEFTLQ